MLSEILALKAKYFPCSESSNEQNRATRELPETISILEKQIQGDSKTNISMPEHNGKYTPFIAHILIVAQILTVHIGTGRLGGPNVSAARVSCDEEKYGYICEFKDKCGSLSDKLGTTPWLLQDTNRVAEGEFPMLGDILVENRKGACYAVLVSDSHLITPYKCVVSNGKRMDPREIRAFLFGKYQFTNPDFGEVVPLATVLRVEKVCIHPEASRASGLVLLKLEKRLVLGDQVQPVCWPLETKKLVMGGPTSSCYQLRHMNNFTKQSRHFHVRRIQEKIRVEGRNCKSRKQSRNGASICLLGYPWRGRCIAEFSAPSFCLDLRGRWTMVGMSRTDQKGDCSPTDLIESGFPDPRLAKLTAEGCEPPLESENPI